ncbi:MAG: DUF3871 family protein [Segetibacter sp.]
MEIIHQPLNHNPVKLLPLETDYQEVSTSSSFIEANTIESSLTEIKDNHIIPVFIKDNETVISHFDFIETTQQAVRDCFHGELILTPAVRVSHPIKGRIPEARNKPAAELMEHEKTIYYERMAFTIEIPSIQGNVAGNYLSLVVGGVKAYNLDNLYTKKGVDEHFKVFIGFQNRVCTNLCVWTDGYLADLKVVSVKQLKAAIFSLIEAYDNQQHLSALKRLREFSLSEEQFARLLGRCRMYNHLPTGEKIEIPALQMGDTQIGMVARSYFKDPEFSRESDGSISFWKLYNLFTGINKSSYIDTFLDRGVNAFDFSNTLSKSMELGRPNWFLS